MKPIREFTHEELLAMDNDAIDRQVKIECALDGVRMLPIPIKPNANIVGKNDFYFELSGSNLRSRTREPLDRILDAIEKERTHLIKVDYTYKYGFSDYHVTGQNNEEITVDRKLCFLLSDLDARGDVLAKQKEEKDRYEEAKTAFDKEQKKVVAIRQDVINFVFSAREKQSRIDDLQHAFAEYVDLANGNEDQALTFFNKAYGELDSELLNPVIGHLMNRPKEMPESERTFS